MTDLDFPVLDAPPFLPPPPVVITTPLPTLPEVPSIKATVLAQFKEAEVSIVALAAKYRNVAYDVATTKGMREATAARLELREKGRFAVQRAEKAVKADVNDLKRVMADEVERLVAIVQPVEDAIDAQIKAEELRKAAAKAERDRIEAERIARHQAGIDKVRGYLARCQGADMTADRISIGIGMLEGVTFGPEWQEFAVPAANAQCETLEAMRSLHAQAAEREAEALRLEAERQAEAERLEAQRAEQARVAAEQAEQARKLEERATELARQQREADANLARMNGLQARIAEIRAAATGHERATTAALAEAITAVAALDVSEANFQEFHGLAGLARESTLAVLKNAHYEAIRLEQAVEAESLARIQPLPAYPEPMFGECSATPEGDRGPAAHQVGAVLFDYSAGEPQAIEAPDFVPEVLPEPTLMPGAINARIDPLDAAEVDLLGDPVAQPAGEDNHELAQCRAALSQALSMLDDLIRAHATPREAVPLFARVSAIRDLGGLPCAAHQPTTNARN